MLEVISAALLAAGLGASLDLLAVVIARRESALVGRVPGIRSEQTPVDHHRSGWPTGRLLVPVLSAVLGAACAARLHTPAMLVTVVPLVCLVTVLGVIDMNTRRLPNLLTVPAIPVGVGLVVAATALGAPLGREALVAAAVASVAAVAIAGWAPSALGMGDAKLICVMVVLVSPVGATAVWVTALGGLLLSGLFSAVLITFGGRDPGGTVPAGPFLAAGAVLAVLLTG